MAFFNNAEDRTDVIALAVGVWAAAPGADNLSELAAYYNAGGNLEGLTAELVNSPIFKQEYPNTMTNEEFATKFVNNAVGGTVDQEHKDWAVDQITSQLAAGHTLDEVILAALDALRNVPTDDPNWGNARIAFENKVEVAEYFSVELGKNGASLADLKAVIAGVDETDASVEAGKDKADGTTSVPPQTFTLTQGIDAFEGGDGNDTFNAVSINPATGNAATTLTAFDELDGGAGTDTLNVFVAAGINTAQNGTVESIEVVNAVSEDGTTLAAADASKYQGVEQFWQINAATAVTNLAASATAGLRNVDTTAAAASVTGAAGASSVSVALDGLKGEVGAGDNVARLNVAGSNTVNVSGTLAQKAVNTTAASLALDATATAAGGTLEINSGVRTTLTATKNGAGTAKDITAIDASGSAGNITYDGTVASQAANARAITTGAGSDTLTIATATNKATAVNASVDSGAGKDTVTINTSGDGTTTVDTGAGNDTASLMARSSGVLTINLGDGDDSISAAGGAVNAGDVVDGGAGIDSLMLNMVGAANIGAFKNFEIFDAKDLGKALDIDILTQNNTVTELTASGDVLAGSSLINIGAGVGFRATDDMGAANALTLTQKTAGALSLALDADSSSTGAANNNELNVVASNATSLTVNFESDSGFTGGANTQTATINSQAATSVTVNSGGANASNVLALNDANTKLTSMTITGDSDLSLAGTAGTTKLATIDASALNGDLTVNTNQVKAETAALDLDGGTITLGSGDDVVTINAGGQILTNIGLGTAEGATSQDGFDVVTTGAAVQQSADADTGTYNVTDGLFTFKGAGPATLADAISDVDTAVTVAGDAVVFEYIGDSYIFVEDAGGDMVVKLSGTTGLEGLAEVGATDQLYAF